MSHHHPSGIIVDVVRIEEPSRDRSCEVHDTCGDIMAVDTIVRFRDVQILGDEGKEETAIAAYWVTVGIDRCQVGFLPRDCVKHKSDFDGKVAQVIELLSKSNRVADRKTSHRNRGVACKVIIEVEVEETPISCSKRKFHRKITMAEVPFPVPEVEEQEMVVEETDEDDNNNKKGKATNTASLSRTRLRTRSQTVKPVAEVSNIKKATDTETLQVAQV